MVATVNGVLVQMIMATMVLYGLADRGQLPAPIAFVWPRIQTPVVATLLVAGAILLLALALPIGDLAEWTSQIVLSVFMAVNFSLIRLKRAGHTDKEHLNLPLIVPVCGLLTSTGLLVMSFLKNRSAACALF